MTDLKLPWGASRSVPDDVATAWGARWIFPDDLLHDRQGFAGGDSAPLLDWLNGGALQAARDAARKLAGDYELRPSEDRTVTLFEDGHGIVVGNPQGSHGYLYVAAWLKPMSGPAFKPGDRFWTHYDYRWGTVLALHHTVRDAVHGVTGNPLPDTTWYDVHYDGDPEGVSAMLDDAHGNWDMARMVPPQIAERYGYGSDPKAAA